MGKGLVPSPFKKRTKKHASEKGKMNLNVIANYFQCGSASQRHPPQHRVKRLREL